jgi:pyridinium-3,5-bisthiocarboxylic acid mononucleotide nickel chelatase
MQNRPFAILDPAAGISGDMLLGALLDAGAPVAWLEELPARLGLDGVRVEVRRVDRAGLTATKVDVRLASGESEGPHDVVEPHAHDHGKHDHQHQHSPRGHGHRHVGDLIAQVERAPLSAWVRERAVRAFRLLGEAEGRVHGCAAESVALHEVGAADAMVDIVGGIEGFERVGVERIHARPLTLGSGWVKAAHGVLPVPTPATAILVEGLDVREGGPVVGEATTPTGAVLLRVLAAGAPPARWRALRSGWGAGGRNPAGYANALRLTIATPSEEAGEVTVLVTDVDDLSPEYLEPLRGALLEAGALDVQLWSTQAKKGRTGFRIEVMVPPEGVERVTEALFRNSTTAGLRRWTAERVTLARREILLEVEQGMSVRVKVLDGPGGTRVKPEFEDVARVAARTGRPAIDVAKEMQRAALIQLGANGGAAGRAPKQES